jgi:phospholipid/cholesterol/gamma-HCH transport system substrate-binding protein
VDNFKGTLLRLAVFLVVCLLGTVALWAVFADLRFDEGRTYFARFANVSNMKKDSYVRIAGVEVGQVKKVSINRDATVTVEFTADSSVVLTEGSRALIRYDNVVGDRFLALEEGAGSTRKLNPGDTIPIDRTQPALDLDAVIGGFRPLFSALSPDKINDLSGQLIQALQGEGPSIGSFLAQAAVVTNTLADRDQLIGQVVTNLNTVLASFGGKTDKLDKAVVSLSQLVDRLAQRKTDISQAVAYTDAAASSIAGLLTEARPPLAKTVHEVDRTAGLVLADHDYFDNFLNTLPDKYRALSRQGIYGDFFSFYLCDAVLKLNGKGGQPVYVKVAGQTSGRCTPR